MMWLDGIMVRRDQYLIYYSTMDRWALLLWGKVCVLKGRKANIHFIRKEENWMLGITKSMITIFPTLTGQELWLQKRFYWPQRDAGIRPLCLTVTFYPCLHLYHSSPPFHSLSLSVHPSLDHPPCFTWLTNLCIDGFRATSQVILLSSIVQRQVPRLICVFVCPLLP